MAYILPEPRRVDDGTFDVTWLLGVILLELLLHATAMQMKKMMRTIIPMTIPAIAPPGNDDDDPPIVR